MLRMRLRKIDMRSASVDESPLKTPWTVASPKRVPDDDEDDDDDEEASEDDDDDDEEEDDDGETKNKDDDEDEDDEDEDVADEPETGGAAGVTDWSGDEEE